jgi:hypothetical protein
MSVREDIQSLAESESGIASYQQAAVKDIEHVYW